MKRIGFKMVIYPGLLALLWLVMSSCGTPSGRMAERAARGELWPELKPYDTGYLQVSELHQIFYQLGGNPKGKPVMVLHGGPGAGCTPQYFRYFNPRVYHIILHDQRGCGQSKPYGELRENTTQDLVEDIEQALGK